ncbi:MAG: hypothetical protein WCK34_11770 [Bacteroidota bacterium]
MATANLKDRSLKQQNKEYFIHLIRIARADGSISSAEMELLHNIGQGQGFTPAEIDFLIESTGKSDYTPPAELPERFGQVYGVVKMTLADGAIDRNEMRIVSTFAAKSDFREDDIPHLLVLLISGIRQGKNEKELFEAYQAERKS